MKYEAPTVVELPSTIEAVQSSTHKTSFPLDLEGMVTVSAYHLPKPWDASPKGSWGLQHE
jgi:hypothetical protein